MSAVQVLTGALFTQRLKYLFFPFILCSMSCWCWFFFLFILRVTRDLLLLATARFVFRPLRFPIQSSLVLTSGYHTHNSRHVFCVTYTTSFGILMLSFARLRLSSITKLFIRFLRRIMRISAEIDETRLRPSPVH